MHPKAVFLALHGFVLTEVLGTKDGRYRIKRNTQNSEEMLHFTASEASPGNPAKWAIGNANIARYYVEIPWNMLPSEIMDKLPQELIDTLVG